MAPVIAVIGAERLVGFLADHGMMLLAGVTAMLGAGAAALRLQRSPIQRQRLGELTVAGTLLWLVLAVVPLPRLQWGDEAPPAPTRFVPPAAPRPRPLPARTIPGPETRPASPLHFATAAPANRGPDAPTKRRELSPAPVGQEAAPSSAILPSDSMTDTPAMPAAMAPDATRKPPAAADPRLFVAGVYLIGAAVCSAWLLLGVALLDRLVRRGRPAPPWLQGLLESLSDATGHGPRLLVSAGCPRPVSCGVLRPTILLPAPIVFSENLQQLRQVLLHELAHVRQRDAWGNGLFNLGLPLLYAHPLYWLLRREVHQARELVADDWAAARSDKAAYVRELVAMARSSLGRSTWPAGPVGQIALFRSPTNFYRRMHMLMQRQEPLATSCPRGWRFGTLAATCAALLVAAATAGLQPARAQETPGDPAASSPQDVEKLKQQLLATKTQLDDTMKRLQVLQAEAKAAQDQQAQREVALREHLDQLAEQHAQLQALKGRALAEKTEQDLRLNEQYAQAADEKRKARAANPPGSLPARRDATGTALAYGLGSGSGQLDLVALALSYIDAVGSVRTAQAQVERTAQLLQSHDASPMEMELQKASLDIAQRKAQLLRGVVEVAISGTKFELKAAHESDNSERVAQAETKIKILELILQSGR